MCESKRIKMKPLNKYVLSHRSDHFSFELLSMKTFLFLFWRRNLFKQIQKHIFCLKTLLASQIRLYSLLRNFTLMTLNFLKLFAFETMPQGERNGLDRLKTTYYCIWTEYAPWPYTEMICEGNLFKIYKKMLTLLFNEEKIG